MNIERLQEILAQFENLRIAVMGDFFLDHYLIIDPSLNEISIETGKTAYQVVAKRPQPGAAGTVCNNLSALGVGELIALSVIGDDGEGFELKKALQARRVDTSHIVVSNERFTPTYTKPMLRSEVGEEELNRQDIKNRSPLPSSLEDQIKAKFELILPTVDAVILADQVQERNCGVITTCVREFIAEQAGQYPDKLILADSRGRIGEFRNVTVKPNRFEAAGAVIPTPDSEIPSDEAILNAQELSQRTGKPVYLTLDKEGICPINENEPVIILCPPVTGPIDIVGAGDSVTAGIVSALSSGASPIEAAIIGNLTASVTIRQLGTTGTATKEQLLEALQNHSNLYQDYS